MRVLFTVSAWPTHFFTTAPLAWAFRSAGHCVRVACPPFMTRLVAESGLTAVTCGPDVDFVALRKRSLPDERPAGTGGADGGEEGSAASAFDDWHEATTANLDDVVALARSWRPGLVVADTMSPGGLVAARLLDVPAVRHLLAPDILGTVDGDRMLPAIPRFYEPYERAGLHVDGDPAHRTVTPSPPSMEPPASPNRLQMSYVPYNGRGLLEPGFPAARRPGRPRVCVTWGHSVTRILGERSFLVPRILRAVVAAGADPIAVINSEQRTMLGRVPEGTSVLTSAPLHQVLPSCDLIVHQGGAGSVLTAARHGVPQLALPQLPDQVHAADPLGTTGAGLVADPGTTEADLAEHVRELLAARYAEAADDLSAEIHAQPSPAAVAAALHELAASAA